MIEPVMDPDLVWMMSTFFGKTVLVMFFLTWGLVLVNLFLLMLYLVHQIFGRCGISKKTKK